MAQRIKAAVALAMVCLLCGAVMACGVSASAQGGAAHGLRLHVVRIKDGAARPSLDTYVNDGAAVQRLYSAALQLPVPPRGAIFHCPFDDGVVYHLTFIGGTVTARRMDLQASGCRFLEMGDDQAHMTTDTFISLFTKTAGQPSLDPGFPNS